MPTNIENFQPEGNQAGSWDDGIARFEGLLQKKQQVHEAENRLMKLARSLDNRKDVEDWWAVVMATPGIDIVRVAEALPVGNPRLSIPSLRQYLPANIQRAVEMTVQARVGWYR